MCSVLWKQNKNQQVDFTWTKKIICIKELEVNTWYIQELDNFSIYLCNDIHEIAVAVFDHCFS